MRLFPPTVIQLMPTTRLPVPPPLERFDPREIITEDVFDDALLDWRTNPRVKTRGKREKDSWNGRDAALTLGLTLTWALGPIVCATACARAVVRGGGRGEKGKAMRRRALLVSAACAELGWFAYRRDAGRRAGETENMRATPSRRDFDRFLQLRHDAVLDFQEYIRGWMKTWKKFVVVGGDAGVVVGEGDGSDGKGDANGESSASPPARSTSSASSSSSDSRGSVVNVDRESALDFLRFGFHDALSAEEIGEQKERELRIFMDEIEARWDVKFDEDGERGFEFMFHTKEKLGALHQPLLFTAWVNAVAGVSGVVLYGWGFRLHHGENGCAYWCNAPVVVEDWKRVKMPTATRKTRYGKGIDTRPILCGDNDPSEDDGEEIKPIIFIHGLGVGLAPYLPHIAQLLRSKPGRKIALLTLPHISMRAAPRVPELDDMVDTVVEITKKHAFRAPTMYGHSFGPFVVARTCQRFAVSAVALIDPVAVCLCLPQTVGILYQLHKSWSQFKDRLNEGPKALMSSSFWSEGGALLYFLLRDYFLLRETGVMTALRRKFWWARYNLWADDLPRHSLIVLESNDLLIDGEAIARHVLRQSEARIIWQDKFVHGEFVSPWGHGLRDEIVQFLDNLPPHRCVDEHELHHHNNEL